MIDSPIRWHGVPHACVFVPSSATPAPGTIVISEVHDTILTDVVQSQDAFVEATALCGVTARVFQLWLLVEFEVRAASSGGT